MKYVNMEVYYYLLFVFVDLLRGSMVRNDIRTKWITPLK